MQQYNWTQVTLRGDRAGGIGQEKETKNLKVVHVFTV
jgi:hypothetical protein